MDDKTVSLILGLGGTISTLIASGVGFYFTARARRTPLREALFMRQLDLIVRLIQTYGRITTYATILKHRDSEYWERAREDSRVCIKEFSEMQEEGSAILPTELWIEVKRLNGSIADAFVFLDETGSIDDSHFMAMSVQGAKTALLSRTVLGVDELSDESLKLLSMKKDYDRVSGLGNDEFERLHKEVNAKNTGRDNGA